MPKALILRVQTKAGSFPLRTLHPESTLWELQEVLGEKTKFRPEAQKILLGYPPREIESYDPGCTLLSLRIRSGETLKLEELPAHKARTKAGVQGAAASQTPQLESRGSTSSGSTKAAEGDPSGRKMGELLSCPLPFAREELIRRVVPADNSCLFTSVSVLLGDSGDSSEELRELAAAIILSSPDKYSSAILGKTNQEYVQWVRRKDSWGGAIELKVFSEHYKVELDVVDIQTQRIDRFGEDRGYATRAFLLYDGIHYDPLIKVLGGRATYQGVFPVEDEAVVSDALQIAGKAHTARQFTDVSGFSLRCLVCGQTLRGQGDAMTHAKLSGHSNFGEV